MDERARELERKEKELEIAREAVEVKSLELEAREEAFELVQKKRIDEWRGQIELAEKTRTEIQAVEESAEKKLKELEEKEEEFESLGSYIEERGIRVRENEVRLEERRRAVEAREKEIERSSEDLKSREGDLEKRLGELRGKEGRIEEMESEIQDHKRRLGELEIEVKVMVEIVRGFGDEVNLQAGEMIGSGENRVQDDNGELHLQKMEMEMEKTTVVKERELGCEEGRWVSRCNDVQLVVKQESSWDESNEFASRGNGEHEPVNELLARIRRSERLKKRHAADSVDRTQTSLVEERVMKKRHVDLFVNESNNSGDEGATEPSASIKSIETGCSAEEKETEPVTKSSVSGEMQELESTLQSSVEPQTKMGSDLDSVDDEPNKQNSEGRENAEMECNVVTKQNEPAESPIEKCTTKLLPEQKQLGAKQNNAPAPAPATATARFHGRYVSQKERDWKRFSYYYSNVLNQPAASSAGSCTGSEVVEYLKHVDKFGKTRVHIARCANYGSSSSLTPSSSSSSSRWCDCPLRQAWGSLDSMLGRLSAAREERGIESESNPFGSKEVRAFLKGLKEEQDKARGPSFMKKKKRKKLPATPPESVFVDGK